ncbi:MAG: hypothetical protein ACTSVL_00120 [Promethearchaeota archaeon]
MADIKKLRELNFYRNFEEISFKELPEVMPELETIRFYNCIINNLEDLKAKMPNLNSMRFSDCLIHKFHGIPKSIEIVLHYSLINSFEGLELQIPHNKEESQIYLRNCTVRSFSGISRTTLQAILCEVLSKDFPEQKYNDNVEFEDPELHKQRLHQIKLDLPITGLNLLCQSINPEIERRYSPKLNPRWPSVYTGEISDAAEKFPNIPIDSFRYSDIPNYYLNEWQLYRYKDGTSHEEELQNYAHKEDWVYGFDLTEKIFIPEYLDSLHEYYLKTTRQLAQEYVTNPSSLSPELIDRLIHEIDPELRKMLENNLPPSNSVIKDISAKFSIETPKGLKILKYIFQPQTFLNLIRLKNHAR